MNSAQGHTFTQADDYVAKLPTHLLYFSFFKGVEIFVHLKASFWFIVLDHLPSG